MDIHVYVKSLGAKRVMRQNKKNPVFGGFCQLCYVQIFFHKTSYEAV